ncbi:hypothetical protein Ancab_003230 [Ancistrocladus abbreviatus]
MRSYIESRQWPPGSLRGHRTYKEVVTEIPKKVDDLHEGGATMQNDGIGKPDHMTVLAREEDLRNYSVSPEKEPVNSKARCSASPGTNDYELHSLDDLQLCSRKGLDVALAGKSNSAEERDELHVLSAGKLGEVALMEDLKASAERRESGTAPPTTAGNHHQHKFPPTGGLSESRAAVDLGGSGPSVSEAQSKKPRKGKVKALLNPAGKPIVVGLKLSKKPKTPKPQSKLNKKRPVPTEVDLSCVRTERCVTGRPAEVAQVSGASLNDSNIKNMNRVLLKKMATEEAKAIWAIGKRLGVQSNEEELTVIQHIAQLQSRP